jgi:DNA-binding NtrC family response regulator
LLPEFIPLDVRWETPDEPMPGESGLATGTDGWQELGKFVETVLAQGTGDGYRQVIQKFDRLVIQNAMNQSKGMQARAAEILGLSRPTLRSKLRTILSAIEREKNQMSAE